jgi:hypothetical protein
MVAFLLLLLKVLVTTVLDPVTGEVSLSVQKFVAVLAVTGSSTVVTRTFKRRSKKATIG